MRSKHSLRERPDLLNLQNWTSLVLTTSLQLEHGLRLSCKSALSRSDRYLIWESRDLPPDYPRVVVLMSLLSDLSQI